MFGGLSCLFFLFVAFACLVSNLDWSQILLESRTHGTLANPKNHLLLVWWNRIGKISASHIANCIYISFLADSCLPALHQQEGFATALVEIKRKWFGDINDIFAEENGPATLMMLPHRFGRQSRVLVAACISGLRSSSSDINKSWRMISHGGNWTIRLRKILSVYLRVWVGILKVGECKAKFAHNKMQLMHVLQANPACLWGTN